MSDVHRNHPEATAEEIDRILIRQLLDAPMTGPTVERDCRDCGSPFALPERLADKARTKWTSLCPSCIAGEL